MTRVVLYHASCADGFAAAWTFHHAWPDAKLIAVQHGRSIPEGLAGNEVTVVDFSYPRDVMFALRDRVASLRLLDHHKSAYEDMTHISIKSDHLESGKEEIDRIEVPLPDWATFDMKRSGAGLAWDYLHDSESRPWIIDYVQDRDLWNWALPNSKEVNAALRCLPFDYKAWDEALVTGPEAAAVDGRAILRYQDQIIRETVSHAESTNIGGHIVPCANIPILQSEIGHELSKGQPFAATYFIKDGTKIVSLRSQPEGMDVSEIAKKMGGGGHKHAAGFRIVAEAKPTV